MTTKTEPACWCGRSPDEGPRKLPNPLTSADLGATDPRIAALVDATGHTGPWCDPEFRAAGLVTSVTAADLAPPKPASVVEAEQAEAAALEQYREAEREWEAAQQEARRGKQKREQGPGAALLSLVTGVEIDRGDADDGRAARKLRERADELREQRDDAARELVKAKEATRKALRDWRGEREGR